MDWLGWYDWLAGNLCQREMLDVIKVFQDNAVVPNKDFRPVLKLLTREGAKLAACHHHHFWGKQWDYTGVMESWPGQLLLSSSVNYLYNVAPPPVWWIFENFHIIVLVVFTLTVVFWFRCLLWVLTNRACCRRPG